MIFWNEISSGNFVYGFLMEKYQTRIYLFFFFLELSPLVKLRPFEKIEMKFCKCHISKNIKDRNLKLVSAERG